MTLTIEFDQIAAQYDAQRAHPPAVAHQLGRTLAAQVGAGVLLEIGVGTGRIAIPTALSGCRVIGIDIAPAMLAVAARRSAAAENVALIRADAQQLPIADNRIDVVLAVHVLHLLADWRAGLNEIARVLRPGGMFLQGQDWRDPDSIAGLLRSRLRMIVLDLLPGARPPGAGAAIGQMLARLGGQPIEPLVAASWTQALSPAAILAGMAARFDAETWVLPDDLLAEALRRLREWAAAQWTDLESPCEIEQRFILSGARFS
ncbi:MAG: class I SAM-dependent methyltransferase [Oscillochloris sp.]|nr:class I SAM-dependent methyltransferase [Oscillochloris sp.]